MTSTIALSDFDYRDWDFDRFLRWLEQCALKDMEYYGHEPRESLDAMLSALETRGKQIIAINPGSRYALNGPGDGFPAQTVLLDALTLGREVGARFLVTYLGVNPEQDHLTTVDAFCRLVEPIVERAESAGMMVVVENHFDAHGEDPNGTSLARSPEGLASLLEAVGSPHLRANYDPGNFYVAGIEPYPHAYEVLKDYIGYVHLKDITRYSEQRYGGPPPKEVMTDSTAGAFLGATVGTGALNYEALLTRITSDKAAEVLTYEPHTPVDLRESSCLDSLTYIRSHLAAEVVPT